MLAMLLMAAWATIFPLHLQAQERGKASYYAHKFNGLRTSSGVRFNQDSLYCAHKRYPFGTLLKVKNPRNGKSVVVKVVDRGPHSRGRIIDLSYRAAKEIGIVAAGVAAVEVSIYRPEVKVPYKAPPEPEVPEMELEITDGVRALPEWMPEVKFGDLETEPEEMPVVEGKTSRSQ